VSALKLAIVVKPLPSFTALNLAVIPLPSLAATKTIIVGSDTCPLAITSSHPSLVATYPYLVLPTFDHTAAAFSFDPYKIDPSCLNFSFHTFATAVTIQIDSDITGYTAVAIGATNTTAIIVHFTHHHLVILQNHLGLLDFHRTYLLYDFKY